MIRTCANCGKEFPTYGDAWGYWYGPDITCSYHCMRAMRRRDLDGEEIDMPYKERYHLNDEQKQTIRELRGQGMTYREIAAQLGEDVTVKTVSSYCYREGVPCPVDNKIRKPAAAPALEQLEEMVGSAGALTEKTAEAAEIREAVDLSRLINTLCDVVALIKELYDRIK